jgi:hypothetical protein
MHQGIAHAHRQPKELETAMRDSNLLLGMRMQEEEEKKKKPDEDPEKDPETDPNKPAPDTPQEE